MEPDDDIDFDSDDSLSVVDIADLLAKGHLKKPGSTTGAPCEVQEVRLVNGCLVSVVPSPPKLEKLPCEGVTVKGEKTLPAGAGHVLLAPVSIVTDQLDELTQRQDRLAGTVRKTLTHTLDRVSALEERPTPFWHLGKIQQSCLILCLIPVGFFVLLYALALIGHLIPKLR